MIEVTILIPVASNDGKRFAADMHAAFEAHAVGLFGGITRLPHTAVGNWIDDGITYADETILYVVALPSIVDGGKVGLIASYAAAHYGQEAIYVRYLGMSEIL